MASGFEVEEKRILTDGSLQKPHPHTHTSSKQTRTKSMSKCFLTGHAHIVASFRAHSIPVYSLNPDNCLWEGGTRMPLAARWAQS